MSEADRKQANPPKPAFRCQRPEPSNRRFVSPVVEEFAATVRSAMADEELSWMFGNCFSNTLDTTVFFERQENGFADTYVITGDIAAMWLRDSVAQIWPFLGLTNRDPLLQEMIAGVIRRQARCLLLDPYANAFYQNDEVGKYQNDLTEMRPGVHERKWELDSPAAFLRLSQEYWQHTGDADVFDATWLEAVNQLLQMLRVEQGDGQLSPYRFQRNSPAADSLTNEGRGDPTRSCGLIRSAFRPSDDPCKLPFLVPSNAMMSVALENVAALLDALNNALLASQAMDLASQIREGLERHAVVNHESLGEIWAYEVDGFGGNYLMDDANIPSLLSLPYLGFCSPQDPRYLRTRAFCLSAANPYFIQAPAWNGISSPHAHSDRIWPMSVIMRALTSECDGEIMECLRTLKATHAGTGFMHEAFDAHDPAIFSRSWFSWANTLFGELIVKLHSERPHLLQQKINPSQE